MPAALSSEHLSFFEKNQFIELEGILSPVQAQGLKELLDAELKKRSQLSPASRLQENKAQDQLQSRYNLHLSNSAIRRVTHKASLASLASELFRSPTIRFGFDLYISPLPTTPSPFLEPLPLEQTSCLSPLAGALLIALEEGSLPGLPQKPGSALFFSPQFPLPWPTLFSSQGAAYFLIGFAKQKTFFKAGTQDPLARLLKKESYVFNDLLKEPLHPLLKGR